MEQTTESAALPFLTFRLGAQSYALDIPKVREVLNVSSITRIPRAPEYMIGVINLRGKVVSVVDLSLKFGLDRIEDWGTANIIIIELRLQDEVMLLGILVDSVQEVVELRIDAIESSPRLGLGLSSEFIKGIGKRGEEFLILLDLDKVFSVGELGAFTSDTKIAENI